MNARTSGKHRRVSLDFVSYIGIIVFITVNIILAVMSGAILAQFYRVYEIIRGIP